MIPHNTRGCFMFGMNSYDDIVRYVETAVGEIGYDEYAQQDFPSLMKKAKRLRIQDVGGWLADQLYNDSGTVSDLMGDQLYELISSKYKEDPGDAKVWAKHLVEMQKRFPHVKLS